MDEINTENVKPTFHVIDVFNQFREDQSVKSYPREKILEIVGENVGGSKRPGEKYETGRPQRGKYKNDYEEKGYTDCGCNVGFNPGIVLDPFMGSGTTGVVAKKNNRDWLGIEINPEYIKMAEQRINNTMGSLF